MADPSAPATRQPAVAWPCRHAADTRSEHRRVGSFADDPLAPIFEALAARATRRPGAG